MSSLIIELEHALEVADKHYDMLAEENEKLRLKVERLEAEKMLNLRWCRKTKDINHIVQVKHISNPYGEGYIFNVPEGKELKQDDIVLCETKGGTPSVARCITDSKWVDDDVLKMIMGEKKVISRILGKYELKECDTDE